MDICTCITGWGLPGGKVVNNLPANTGDARDVGSIPLSGRCPGGGNSNPFGYSCLENPHVAWWATVHRLAKSSTQMTWLSMHACTTGSLCHPPETNITLHINYTPIKI